MQSAADGMLRETLDCYDDGTVEESDLSVIALTLEQFHHAVADRRVVLGAGVAGDAANARRLGLIGLADFFLVRRIDVPFSPCGRRHHL